MATCPDCRQRMQPFYVPARDGGGEVELDRCAQCSSLWFNAGEVEAALGRSVRRKPGASSRTCPTCRVKLELAVMQGPVDVERCGTCQGVFLDGSDVGVITPKKVRKTSGGSGFECDACHERRPFSEAQTTVTGLVCAPCAEKENVKEQAAQAEQRSVFGRFLSWLGGSSHPEADEESPDA